MCSTLNSTSSPESYSESRTTIFLPGPELETKKDCQKVIYFPMVAVYFFIFFFFGALAPTLVGMVFTLGFRRPIRFDYQYIYNRNGVPIIKIENSLGKTPVASTALKIWLQHIGKRLRCEQNTSFLNPLWGSPRRGDRGRDGMRHKKWHPIRACPWGSDVWNVYLSHEVITFLRKHSPKFTLHVQVIFFIVPVHNRASKLATQL